MTDSKPTLPFFLYLGRNSNHFIYRSHSCSLFVHVLNWANILKSSFSSPFFPQLQGKSVLQGHMKVLPLVWCLCHPVTWWVAVATLRNEMVQPVGEALGVECPQGCWWMPTCLLVNALLWAELFPCLSRSYMQLLYFTSPLCLPWWWGGRIASGRGLSSSLDHLFPCYTGCCVLFPSTAELECHSQHTSHPGDCSRHRWLFVAEYMWELNWMWALV